MFWQRRAHPDYAHHPAYRPEGEVEVRPTTARQRQRTGFTRSVATAVTRERTKHRSRARAPVPRRTYSAGGRPPAAGLAAPGRLGGKNEADARAGLLVDGFRQAVESHLVKIRLMPSPRSRPMPRSAQILAMRGFRANLVICDGRAMLGGQGTGRGSRFRSGRAARQAGSAVVGRLLVDYSRVARPAVRVRFRRG